MQLSSNTKRTRFGAFFVCLAAALAFGLPTSASAQDFEPIGLSNEYRGEAGVDFTLFTRSVDTGLGGDIRSTMMNFLFRGQYRILDNVQLSASMGVTGAILSTDDDSESAWLAGNPYVEGRYVHALDLGGMGLELSGGLGVAIPVASADEGAEFAAVSGGIVTNGFRDGWLWSSDEMTFVVPIGVRTTGPLVLDASVKFALTVPVRVPDGFEGENEFLTQIMVQGGYQLVPEMFELGGGLSAFLVLTGEGDIAQTALSLYAKGYFGPGVVSAEFLMNLDDPAGFAFDDDGFWGLTLSAGARF